VEVLQELVPRVVVEVVLGVVLEILEAFFLGGVLALEAVLVLVVLVLEVVLILEMVLGWFWRFWALFCGLVAFEVFFGGDDFTEPTLRPFRPHFPRVPRTLFMCSLLSCIKPSRVQCRV